MIAAMNRESFEQFWPAFKDIILQQETYAFDAEMTCEESYQLWCASPIRSYGWFEENVVLGTYYLKANAMGPSNHICNCGYMVKPDAGGQGIARKLCEHSQLIARQLGFEAMQFNSVVSTNERAIRLWKTLGFDIIGTIPKAYRHPRLGYVDSFIMHKLLG
ncbi:GNAT family N-acetyltransferase [Pleionea litopenaei]|uniref:GNAT family N-acetyltransferase n=1 Tax=Pleionea litopenaei TaxID=3070815 RepID=A0AA51RW27_9GAMM|nr:GNAT family N-acetyltransferase [Pleionea sp. HL-JVS1]WMS88647.1 GNAT family N-acetyltransferase [Pleionea sp. HL-JVS1]